MRRLLWTPILSCVLLANPQAVMFADEDGVPPPNVVLIVSDDQDYTDLSCYPHPTDVHTPNLDRLAKGGVRFTQAYATAPVCAPSRAGLMTGRYQQRFGCYTNLTAHGVPETEVFLPAILRDAGYATAAIGKWHLGQDSRFHPQRRGFDDFFGFLPGMHDYFNSLDTPGYRPILRGETPVESVEYLTRDFGTEAVDFITANATNRFFLYLAFNAVHTPYQAPKEYRDRFADRDPNRATYLAMLAALDDQVGRVLDALERCDVFDNTIVVFLSDNGGTALAERHAGEVRPIRGHKGQTYEGGIRVPMLLQWPARFAGGQVFESPVSTLDLAPTLLAATQSPIPSGVILDGKDLTPFLTRGSRHSPHDAIFWFYPGKNEGEWWAVRASEWKLVHTGGGAIELYDVEHDAREEVDLSARRPDLVDSLRSRFDAWKRTLAAPYKYKKKGPIKAIKPPKD